MKRELYARLFSIKLLATLSFCVSVLIAGRPALAAEYGAIDLPGYGAYNGFNSHLNDFECTNHSERSTAQLRITLIRYSGQTIESRLYAIPPTGTLHIRANDFRDSSGRGIENDYGLAKVEDIQHSLDTRISCLSVFYKFRSGSSVPEYSFTIPFENPQFGTVWGMYNSIDPSVTGAAVWNFISVSNPGTSRFTGSLVLYNQAGSVTSTRSIDIEPSGRLDYAAGHDEGQITGLYKIVPNDPNQPFISFAARYHTLDNGQSFKFGFALATQQGTCNETLNASTMGTGRRSDNWLELGNNNSTTTPVTIEVRDRNGNVTLTERRNIPPYSQDNFFINPYIDPQEGGNVGTVRVICDPGTKILAQTGFYGHPDGDTVVRWAYVTQARGIPAAETGDRLITPINTWYGDALAANWLKVSNSGPSAVQLNIKILDAQGTPVREETRGIDAGGTLDYDVHTYVGVNFVGTVAIKTDSPNALLRSELVRVFYRTPTYMGVVMPTRSVVVDNSTDMSSPCQLIAYEGSANVLENQATPVVLQGGATCGGGVTFELTSSPQHGLLTGQLPSSTFTPSTHYLGADAFSFRVGRSGQWSQPAVISLSISPRAGEENFGGVATSLARYRDRLTKSEAVHLMQNFGLGGNQALIDLAQQPGGLDAVADAMVSGLGTPPDIETQALTLAENFKSTYNTTVNDCTYRNLDSQNRRWNTAALQSYVNLKLVKGHALKERLTYLLHNHITVGVTRFGDSNEQHQFMKLHYDMLNNAALGRFDNLIESLHWDGAMAYWLDNRLNTQANVNENYGRELAELFALGSVDPMTGVHNYTLDDVHAFSQAVAGFYIDTSNAPPYSRVVTVEKDASDPECASQPQFIDRTQITHRVSFNPRNWMPDPLNPLQLTVFRGKPHEATSSFRPDSPNTSISNYMMRTNIGASNEFLAAPRYLGNRLFAVLVNPAATEEITNQLARELLNNDYNLAPVVKTLIKASSTYAKESRKAGINSPIEQFTTTMRQLGLPMIRVDANNDTTTTLRGALINASNDWGNPASVFGAKDRGINRDTVQAYGEVWLASQRLLYRQRGIQALLNEIDDVAAGASFSWDSLVAGVPTAPTAGYAGRVVDHLADKLAIQLTTFERDKLIEYLTKVMNVSGGNTTYHNIVFHPSDPNWVNIAKHKLPKLISIMFMMVEGIMR